MFSKVFENVGFRYFEDTEGPLGPILAPLGPIWSQNVPPKCLQKVVQQLVKKVAPKLTNKIRFLSTF